MNNRLSFKNNFNGSILPSNYFLGTFEKCDDYSTIIVNITTNHNNYNLQCQQANNNNFGHHESIKIEPSKPININCNYFRISIANSSPTDNLTVTLETNLIKSHISGHLIKSGFHGNLCDNTNILTSSYSEALDVSTITKASILYRDSNVNTSLYAHLTVSVDEVNFYNLLTINPEEEKENEGSSGGSFRHIAINNISLDGIKYIRLENNNVTDLTNVYCSVVGNN